MMEPVTALASYMSHVDGAVLPKVFVDDGPTIVEDFAPFVFSGRDAAAQWDSGFRQHAIPLRDLKFGFGPANAFEQTGDRVYFVLPTTWSGIYKDRRFEEHGAWSFVLKNTAGQWRILLTGGAQPICKTGRRSLSSRVQIHDRSITSRTSLFAL
jgi:hypothetical protein